MMVLAAGGLTGEEAVMTKKIVDKHVARSVNIFRIVGSGYRSWVEMPILVV